MTIFNPGPGTKRFYQITEVRTVRVTANVWAEDSYEAYKKFEDGVAFQYQEEVLSAETPHIVADESKGFR